LYPYRISQDVNRFFIEVRFTRYRKSGSHCLKLPQI
jgi:hypothetical protein